MAIASNYREKYAKYTRQLARIVQVAGQKPEVRASIELLLTFLTISFFAVFAIRPTANTIAKLIADVKTQKDIQVKLNDKITNLKKAQTVYAQEKTRIALLDQAYPKNPQPDTLASQLENLAAQNSLKLESLNVGKTTLAGKIAKDQAKVDESQFELSFLVKGEYRNILLFLKDTENLRRLINVTSVSMGVSKKSGDEGAILLTVGAQIPYYPDTN
ncbi:MAG: type 4a pilus biogenesis protein PilO [Candidatus Blackburnbacteria bacterium]|nr:type 4a pilus biogenesis protein PilO [Candidatus Blackburnbacteria bacterium]